MASGRGSASGRGARLDLAALSRGLESNSTAADKSTAASNSTAAAVPPVAGDPAPTTAATGSDGTYLITVPVDTLAPNPRNSRDHLGDLEDLSTIVDVQLQPATVVSRDSWLRLYTDDADTIGDAEYVVVNGCRRLAAARKFGRPNLDVIVHDSVAADDESVIAAMLIENIAREDLDPIEEAKGVQMLVNAASSNTEVALRLGKSKSWVSKRLKICNLHPDLLQEMRNGNILIKEAYELGRIPRGEQVAAWMAKLDAIENPAPAPEPESNPEPDTTGEDSGSEKPDPVGKIVRALRGVKADPETVVAALEEFFDPEALSQVNEMIKNELIPIS